MRTPLLATGSALTAIALALTVGACGQNPAPSSDETPAADGAMAPTTDATGGPTDGAMSPAPSDGAMTPGGETPPPSVPASGEQGGTDDWRQVVKTADASALGRLDQAWRLGRAEAEDRGFADEVEALGPLVDPNAGQAGRLQPGPGTYRCRTIKMGTRTEGQGLAYIAYPFFRCTVEMSPGGDLVLTKGTGSQRSRGLLYPDTDRRLVFVGAQAWGDETAYPTYGQTRERDQVGAFERIGADRWRLVIPWPKQEAKIEILELTR
jgi:hypothetical protein